MQGRLEISSPRFAGPGVAARAAELGERAFGALVIVVALSLLAPLPLLGLAALGYLVHGEARVARSGRLRDVLFGTRAAARVGTIALGTWLALLAPRALAARAAAVRIVDPASAAVSAWSAAAAVAMILALLHVAGACLRGGRARDFVLPRVGVAVRAIFDRAEWARARDLVWDALILRGGAILLGGARAMLVGVAWLAIPTLLLFAATRASGGLGAVAALAGAPLLAIALVLAPFAQGRAAVSERLAAGLDVRATLSSIARAPIASLFATLVTLSLAAPLHLLKIEPVPDAVAWIPSLGFVLFGLPSRALVGWALARGARRATPAHLATRAIARAIALAFALAYVLVAALSQYTSWRGAMSLFEQHVVLVPTPFVPFVR